MNKQIRKEGMSAKGQGSEFPAEDMGKAQGGGALVRIVGPF